MKKHPAPPIAQPPARTRFWRALAVFSLAANLALALWGWHVVTASAAIPHPAPVPPKTAEAPAPQTAAVTHSRELSPYAALGSFMAENNRISDLGWTKPQFAAFLDGMRASYEGRGLPLDDDAKRLRDAISQRVQAMLGASQPDPIADYFQALREKEGVSRTASGLHYRITEPGLGAQPKPEDTVVISFAARLPDGKSLPHLSRARVTIAVHDLLPGLAEGVQLLHIGGKALVYLPPSLAYSEADWPAELPKHTPIVFFLELHDINPSPAP
jgi:FKBP-type peptidyl-prolyl cis-trans isomerase